MTTRELIEAVREPETGAAFVDRDGRSVLTTCISAKSYNDLRDACAAVLDELIPACEACDNGVSRLKISHRPMQESPCPICTNARALREKLR